MHSCLYEGRVWHRRNGPITHQFQNRLFFVYLDLAELPEILSNGSLIGQRKTAVRSFIRADHLFDTSMSLDDEVRSIVETQTGVRPLGPIRLLTQLRHFGHYFSPLNVFYGFEQDRDELEYAVAEVSNTPWRERHCYTLWKGNRCSDHDLHFSYPKEFHVSPFMQMDHLYRWKISQPGPELIIRLSNYREDTELFAAGMTLSRLELTKKQLNLLTLKHPMMTAQILAAIYFQALRLWWKKCPFYKHPNKLRVSTTNLASAPPNYSKIHHSN